MVQQSNRPDFQPPNSPSSKVQSSRFPDLDVRFTEDRLHKHCCANNCAKNLKKRYSTLCLNLAKFTYRLLRTHLYYEKVQLEKWNYRFGGTLLNLTSSCCALCDISETSLIQFFPWFLNAIMIFSFSICYILNKHRFI